MSEPSNLEARVAALESIAEDAVATRHMVAAVDRDVADLGIKVNALREAFNGFAVQTTSRLDEHDRRFDRLENEMRAGFATAAAGQQVIVGLLNTIIDGPDGTA